MVGGGPFESSLRIITQDNMISELEPGMKTNVIKAMDAATAVMMRYFSAVVPNVSDKDFVDHVAYGFDVGPRPARAMPSVRSGLSAARDPLGLHSLEATGDGPMSSMRRTEFIPLPFARRRPNEFQLEQPARDVPGGPQRADRSRRRKWIYGVLMIVLIVVLFALSCPGHAGHEGGQGAAGRSAGPIPRSARPEPDGVGPDRSHERNDPPGDFGHAGRCPHDALVEGGPVSR